MICIAIGLTARFRHQQQQQQHHRSSADRLRRADADGSGRAHQDHLVDKKNQNDESVLHDSDDPDVIINGNTSAAGKLNNRRFPVGRLLSLLDLVR